MFDRRLLAMASGEWLRLAGVTVLGLAITVTFIAQSLALASLLGDVIGGAGLDAATGPILVVAGSIGVRFVLGRRREALAARAAGRIKSRLRSRLYDRLLELGPAYTAGERTGAVQSVMVDGVEQLEKYYSKFLPVVGSAVVGTLLVVVVIFLEDPAVGWLVGATAVIVPVAPIVMRRLALSRSSNWFELYRSLFADSLDAVQGMATLKSFNSHRQWRSRLDAQTAEFSRVSTGLVAVWGIAEGVVGLAAAAGMSLAVGLGALRVAAGAMALPALFVVLMLAREVFRPLTELRQALHSIYPALAAASRVFELLDVSPDVADGPETVPSKAESTVVFDAVTYRYRPDRSPAVRDLSFTVSPGETVALVGPSGSGKSTAVSLLLRFFDPDSGVVEVAGYDVRRLGLADLRSRIAVVSQDTYLFYGSVRYNLLLGSPEASDAELEAALRSAEAHEFVSALPEGLDTVVGERGVRLSGGERQRMAIARALLADRPILVLDEATSSVDAVNEAAIQAALDRLRTGRTTIVVAHRLSTVRGADRIIVLDRGQVVEAGSHDELMVSAGRYADLVAIQAAVG